MEMVTCPNCGEENPSKFRLCGFCGHALAPALPPLEERKTVTVFFSDLKGSTNLGEALDPESLREVMSRYFDAMTGVLKRHGATIEKFIGDAIMAVFGLPMLHEDDALRAVRAAIETQEALNTLNEDLQARYRVQLTVRTGVNTGEVVAGDPTTGQRLVTGDTVNVAARLEQAAPSNEVLIGELTYRLVRGAVEVEEVEPLELKGKAERVPAYRLLGVSDATEGFERRQDAPMVGRESEMAALGAIFNRAVDERACRMATVVADAGVGKSRLVREFTGQLAEDAFVVRGKCLPYGEGITFWPLVEAAREAAVIEPDDPPEAALAKLAALTGDEQVTARLAGAIGLSSEQFPVAETFWAARKFLETLARARPVVVVIDDIHWAEPTFLELIGHVIETVEDAAVLLLCTSRHDLLDRHPDWATDANSQRVVLKPLTDADAARVVSGLLGEAGIAGEIEERIVRAAEGNPLFVEQLLSMMIDTGQLHMADGRWEPGEHLANLEVPPSIHALLAARLDHLAREERSVIEPASVIGVTFPQGAVTVLAPEAVRPAVPTHLTAMSRKQLIRSAPSPTPGDVGYRFAHILIRDAAYGGLLKRARATFHEQFVDYAEEVNRQQGRSQEFEEILGYHLEQAYHYLEELGTLDDHARGVGTRAAEKLAAAGRRAMTRGDMSAAANLLRRAAGTLAADEMPHLRLLPDLGEALTELGEFEEAERVLGDALTGAEALGETSLAAEATLRRLLVRLYSGEGDGWADAVTEAVAQATPVFEHEANHAGLAMANRLLFLLYVSTARYGQASEAALRVIEHARAAEEPRLERRGTLAYAQAALYGPTPVEEAIRQVEGFYEAATGDRRTLAILRSLTAQLYAMCGDLQRARDTYAAASAMLRELGSGLAESSTSTELAQIELRGGDLEAAEAALRRDYDELTSLGEHYILAGLIGWLAKVTAAQGGWDETERLSAELSELAGDDDITAQVDWRGLLAAALAHRGELDEARRLAAEAVAMASETECPPLQAEAYLRQADVQREGGDPGWTDTLRAAIELYAAKGDLPSRQGAEALLTADAGA